MMFKKNLIFGILALLCVSSVAFAAGSPLAKSMTTAFQGKMNHGMASILQIPSPVYFYTGSLPAGTTKLVLHWRGSEASEAFEISTQGWAGIALDLRLDYGNIWVGHNKYRISIWQGNQLKETRLFDLICHFEEKVFKDAKLYIDTQPLGRQHLIDEGNNRGIVGSIGNVLVDAEKRAPYVVNYAGEYRVLDAPFSYNAKKQELYEYRNLRTKDGGGLRYGDLYVNGKLVITDVPLVYNDTRGGNSLLIDYQKNRGEVGLYRRDGDGCGYMKRGEVYDLKNGELKRRYELRENEVDEGIVFERENKRVEISVADSLEYRYFTRNGEVWIEKGERNLMPTTSVDATAERDGPCEADPFVLGFNERRMEASVKVDLWDRKQTYTWKYSTLPSYYKTSQ